MGVWNGRGGVGCGRGVGVSLEVYMCVWEGGEGGSVV